MAHALVVPFDRWKLSVVPWEGCNRDQKQQALDEDEEEKKKEKEKRKGRRKSVLVKAAQLLEEWREGRERGKDLEAINCGAFSSTAKEVEGEEGKKNQTMSAKEEGEGEEGKKKQTNSGHAEHIMNNYFSIGVDAEIILRFHRMRERHKDLFHNVLLNKGWYYGMSARTAKTERKSFKNFRDYLEIKVWHGDREEVLHISDRKIKSLTIMNILTYGGARCWGKEDSLASNTYYLFHKRTSDCTLVRPATDDGMLEIVGMRGVAHLGAVMSGVCDAAKLGQATRVEIVTKKTFPAHVDGEPWLLQPSRITIEHLNQARLLINPNSSTTL